MSGFLERVTVPAAEPYRRPAPCDEAVAALDVSIQAQVLNLFLAMRCEFDLTPLDDVKPLSFNRHGPFRRKRPVTAKLTRA